MAGRKGYGEELKIKEHLGEITPKMFEFIKEVFETGTKGEKMQIVTKILPKIIDKGLPTEITGEGGGAIIIQIAQEIAQKNNLQQNDIDPSTSNNSEGHAQV